ncbi:MAG TPA: thiamine diphosphokinase [Candidatus Thermoplasmatota archaeon]|nr:thiamine diphosphokinase [Candidatus Thermoplasmatota archaeon]
MKVALVLNGDEPGNDDLKLLDACDAIVCADGAAQSLLKSNHPPTVIIGDLDSLKPDVYKWAEALDIPIERHNSEKDEIDGELALDRVIKLGATSVLILGGHGGRSAMFLANLKLLRRVHDLGLDGSMVGRGESLRYISAGGELLLAGRTGATLNLLAIDADAVVSLQGTAWDGQDIRLEQKSARGLSNKIAADGARIQVRSGIVLCVVERKAQQYYVM